MPKSDRLTDCTDWIDLEFVERERTPHEIIETGIHLHLAGLSLSNTKQYLEKLGVERSRTAIHNWIQKADLQPADGTSPNRVAVDETAIQINLDRFWLYAAVDPRTNEFLHVDVFTSKINNSLLCFSAISERNTTLTTRSFSLMLVDISQLRSHAPRSDFKSLVMEIGMPSNVFLEK